MNSDNSMLGWIPAFAGMTNVDRLRISFVGDRFADGRVTVSARCRTQPYLAHQRDVGGRLLNRALICPCWTGAHERLVLHRYCVRYLCLRHVVQRRSRHVLARVDVRPALDAARSSGHAGHLRILHRKIDAVLSGWSASARYAGSAGRLLPCCRYRPAGIRHNLPRRADLPERPALRDI